MCVCVCADIATQNRPNPHRKRWWLAVDRNLQKNLKKKGGTHPNCRRWMKRQPTGTGAATGWDIRQSVESSSGRWILLPSAYSSRSKVLHSPSSLPFLMPINFCQFSSSNLFTGHPTHYWRWLCHTSVSRENSTELINSCPHWKKWKKK